MEISSIDVFLVFIVNYSVSICKSTLNNQREIFATSLVPRK